MKRFLKITCSISKLDLRSAGLLWRLLKNPCLNFNSTFQQNNAIFKWFVVRLHIMSLWAKVKSVPTNKHTIKHTNTNENKTENYTNKRTDSRVFQKVQNMQCVAVQWMQVLTHFFCHYAKKSEFLYHFPSNAIRFKICIKNDQISTTKIGKIFKWP